MIYSGVSQSIKYVFDMYITNNILQFDSTNYNRVQFYFYRTIYPYSLS